jgi:flagellar hook-length control protein FliK
MTTASLPVAAPVAPDCAAADPDTTPPGADFLAVLAGIGALQWAPVSIAAEVSPPPAEGAVPEAPAEVESVIPDAIVTAIGLMLAPPREPVRAPATSQAAALAPGSISIANGGQESVLPGPAPEALLQRAVAVSLEQEPGQLSELVDPSRAPADEAPAVARIVEPAATRPTMHDVDLPPPATAKVPVGHPRWAEAVGHEVRLLIDRGLQSATLRLSPEQLGPLEVRIEVADDRAQVWFGATHAETRAALTDALPRLREMLESAGLQLTDAGVHRDAPRDPQSLSAVRPGRSGAPGEDTDAAVTLTRLAAGLVDEYA